MSEAVIKVIKEYKRTDEVAGKWDVLADCIVKLSSDERRHFVNYANVETESTTDLDASAYGINAAALKANRPKELEADMAFVFDFIEEALAQRISKAKAEISNNRSES